MAQRPQSPDGRSGRRGDSTRPPRTRRGGDRVPYPGAGTHDTAGRARATSRPERRSTASRARTAVPIPATVWTSGPEPIDAHEQWPVPIVETITTTLTVPGARVVLVSAGTSPTADAQQAVRALGRTVGALAFTSRADVPATQSRPFWTGFVTSTGTVSEPPTNLPHEGVTTGPGVPEGRTSGSADLVLASLPARAAETVSLDELALLAADRLRCGGIFAVYTHSDWNPGELADPTGAIVASAQHADLLYLQHIVTLHAPVREGRLDAAPTPAMATEFARARHRATVRGLPAPHLRVHGDVLVFARAATSPAAVGHEPDEDRR